MRNICTVIDCNRFVKGHGYCQKHLERVKRNGTPELTMRKQGTGTYSKKGYHATWCPERKKQIRTHILIAEKALGNALPEQAVVHHVDGNPANNVSSNLVVCNNQTHHLEIHRRQRAFDACGDANKYRCINCRQYDDLSNLNGPYGASSTRIGNYRHPQRKKQCVSK